MNYFITGTDTDCGKTFVTSLLVRTARAGGADVVGAKPICCGPRDDVQNLWAANGGVEPMDALNPIWLQTPAAPRACELLGEPSANLPAALAAVRALAARHNHLLCEGAGGWMVPLGGGHMIADFAADLGWPVFVVTGNKLGALNHTLLTVADIRRRGLELAGVILNDVLSAADVATETNGRILEEALGRPLLARVRHGQTHLVIEGVFGPAARG